jgi:transcription termination/antitermination protein NusG
LPRFVLENEDFVMSEELGSHVTDALSADAEGASAGNEGATKKDSGNQDSGIQAAETQASETQASETQESTLAQDSKHSEPTVEGAQQDSSSPAPSSESSVTDAAATQAVEPAKKESTEEFHWYVVNAHSGFEGKAKKSLEERVRIHGMENFFGEVRVPEETVVELVRGQKKTSTRKFFPGYMLVQMAMNRDTWHLVKETPRIIGFIGDATEPLPLSRDEVNRIVQQVEEGASSPKAKMNFQEGESVKVIDGPFAEFNGTVEDVNPDKGKVKVLISIFGRATPVELDFIQIEKV